MALVGLSAMLAPRLRPELYRASASQKSFAGHPARLDRRRSAQSLTGIFVWWAYLHYDQLGANANMGKLLAWTLGPAVLGFVLYFVVAAIRKSQGVNVELAYREIPPE